MSCADEEVSDSTLDKDFVSYLSLAERCIRNKDITRCQKWFEKLCGKLYVDREAKRRRNAYLRRLLIAISKNKLVPPFDREPPTGSLTPLDEIFRRNASDDGLRVRGQTEDELDKDGARCDTKSMTGKPPQGKKSVYSTPNSNGAAADHHGSSIKNHPLPKNGVSGRLAVTIGGKKTSHFDIDCNSTCDPSSMKKSARTKSSCPSSEMSSDEISDESSKEKNDIIDEESGDHTNKHQKTSSKFVEKGSSTENSFQRPPKLRHRAGSLETFPLAGDTINSRTDERIGAALKDRDEALKNFRQEKSGFLFEELSSAEVIFTEPNFQMSSTTRPKPMNDNTKGTTQRSKSPPLFEHFHRSEANFPERTQHQCCHSEWKNPRGTMKGRLFEESVDSSELPSESAGQLAAGFDDMTAYDERFKPPNARSRPPFHNNRKSRASLSIVDRSRDRRSRFTSRPRSSEKMSTVEERTESSASSPRRDGSRKGSTASPRDSEPKPRSKSEPRSESESRSKSLMSRIKRSLTPSSRKREADETASAEKKIDVDTISLATAYDEFCNKQPESAQKNICALYRIYPTAIVDKLLELWKVEGQAVISDYKEIHRQRIEQMKIEFKEDIDLKSEAFQEEKEDLRRWRDCKTKLDRMMDDLTYLHGGGASKEQKQLMEALRIEISEERTKLNEEKEANAKLKTKVKKMSRGKDGHCTDVERLKVELKEVSEKLCTELADTLNDYQEQQSALNDILNV